MSYEIPDVFRDEDYPPPGHGEPERTEDPDAGDREPDHGFYPDWCGDA